MNRLYGEYRKLRYGRMPRSTSAGGSLSQPTAVRQGLSDKTPPKSASRQIIKCVGHSKDTCLPQVVTMLQNMKRKGSCEFEEAGDRVR